MLNAGLGFSDEFEMEACNYSDKSSSKLKQQYRDWLHTMRKDTSAFFKSVKSRVSHSALVMFLYLSLSLRKFDFKNFFAILESKCF